MSKLVFPAAGAPYRGFIGEVRGWLQRIGSFYEKSTGSKADLVAQLNVLVKALGGTQAIVTSGTVITATGTGTTATITVAAGVVTIALT